MSKIKYLVLAVLITMFSMSTVAETTRSRGKSVHHKTSSRYGKRGRRTRRTKSINTKPTGPIYDEVEDMPEFNGDINQYLADNVHYAPSKTGASGHMKIKFVVEKDGSISNPVVIQSIDPALDQEAIRVVNSMPKWTPGKLNGVNVRTGYVLLMSF